jgi:hypothetical protein
MRRFVFGLALLISLGGCRPAENKLPLAELADRAVQQSELTLPGSPPFHLEAKIVETANPDPGYEAKIVQATKPDSEYQGKIEVQWVSPMKWRRTILTRNFAQTKIVNGDQVLEKNTGDYFPHWLNELATALVDPLPMLGAVKKSAAPIPGTGGTAPVYNCSTLENQPGRSTFCFEPQGGLLMWAMTPGYSVTFGGYEPFGEKHVARVIDSFPEPDTYVQAIVTGLTELGPVDEQDFAVPEPTPAREQLKSVRVTEDEVRKSLLNGAKIAWPTTGKDPTTGTCAVYLSSDNKGTVREVLPEGCDNSDMEDSLREQVMRWKLGPTNADGAPVQVESFLTFTFQTTMDQAKIPLLLSETEARRLVVRSVNPVFPVEQGTKETDFSVRITVDEDGKAVGMATVGKAPPGVAFSVACNALAEWRFRPYLVDGKPRTFRADLTFHIPSNYQRLKQNLMLPSQPKP